MVQLYRRCCKSPNARGDIDFVIHGGDQSDFGVTKEFIWMRDIFNKFQMPYVCLLGNHDCLGTGEDAYRAIYGDPNFAFTAVKGNSGHNRFRNIFLKFNCFKIVGSIFFNGE